MAPIHPAPIMASRSKIWEYAENVATRLDFSPGTPIEPVVSHLGGRIEYKDVMLEDAKPESIVIRSRSDFAIFLPTMTTPARERLTIAHELGHLFLHYLAAIKTNGNITMVAFRWVDENDAQLQRAEFEANWFAAAFLMPREAFTKAYNWKSVEDVARLFSVGVHAVNLRAKSLRLVN